MPVRGLANYLPSDVRDLLTRASAYNFCEYLNTWAVADPVGGKSGHGPHSIWL